MNNIIAKKYFAIASLLMALSIALGAFGAHGLKQILEETKLNTFETAVRYQLYHALALFILGFLAIHFSEMQKLWSRSFTFFILGILLFSGSLYLLTIFNILHIDSMRWVGAITPIGGLCFMAGWVTIAVAMLKKK